MIFWPDHGITLGHFLLASANRELPQDPASVLDAGKSFFCKSFKLLSGTIIVLNAGLVGVVSAQSISCTCRYQGEDYGVGESICLKSPGGMKMATCSMVLNNTSWKLSNAPCPLSKLNPEVVDQVKNSKPLPRGGPERVSFIPVSPG